MAKNMTSDLTTAELDLRDIGTKLSSIGYKGVRMISTSDKLVWIRAEFAEKHERQLRKIGLRPNRSQEFRSLRHINKGVAMVAFNY